MSFNPTLHPTIFSRPHYLSGRSAWVEHIPFAYAIVSALRPRTIVELGTHYGDSYCAFCQTANELKLDVRAYAVDTWQGDEHAGFYGEDVLNTLRQAHDVPYSQFSTLVRSTFDEAVVHFGPGTIDLLHIDGLHSYEAVKHDFETWLPLLSDRAVVLFHDTNVRERDFGVWQLWEELSGRYPSFSFLHGHGLGVLGVGGQIPEAMQTLFQTEDEAAVATRNFFAQLGAGLSREAQLSGSLNAQNANVAELQAQLSASQAELAKTRGEIQSASAKLNAVQGVTQELKAQIDELETIPNVAEDKNVELQAQLDRANLTLSAIVNSRTWKLAHPLRQMGGRAAHQRRRLSRVMTAQRTAGGWRPLAQAVYRVWRRGGVPAVLDAARSVSPAGRLVAGMTVDSREATLLEDIRVRLVGNGTSTVAPAAAVAAGPLISLVMPVFKISPALLREAIDSVRAQTYQKWELCIADDCSAMPELDELLAEYVRKDARIKVTKLPENGGISRASNAALKLATGEYIALMDNDDLLTFDALEHVAAAIVRQPEVDLLYSDECKTDESGKPVEIFAKPDWSPMLMLNCMYIGHLGVYRRSLVVEVGGFRSEFDFSQDYDLALRVSERAKCVMHIPHVLYGWRMIASSGSAGGKPFARQTNISALQAAADRRGWAGTAVPLPAANRIQFDLSKEQAFVSIVVPSDNRRNIEDTIKSINDNTTYTAYEIVVVTNSTIVDALSAGPVDSRVRLVRYDKPYSFSDKCNVGAHNSRGQYLVFFNDDVRVITPEWLEGVIEYLERDGVGIVGPKLLYENGTIQHAGMVTGVRRLVGTAFHSLPADTATYFNFAQSVREVSLICGACLGIGKEVFDRVGGFDAVNAPINHSDVDLCFKVRDLGLSCVYTPHATLLHIGHMSLAEVDKKKVAAPRKKDKADIFLLRRWISYVCEDKYFPKPMRDLAYHDSPEPFDVYQPLAPTVAASQGKDILLVSHDLTESGAPRVVLEMARTLVDAGHFVVVASPDDGPLRHELQRLGVAVIVDSLLLTRHVSVRDLARNFDLVIANTAVAWPIVLQLTPFVDVYWYIHETGLVTDLIERYPGFLQALAKVKHVFAGSRRAAGPLRKYRDDVRVMEYGLDPLSIDAVALPNVETSESRRLVVSVFGSYEPRKGQDLFVAGVAALPRSILERCEFHVYGRVLDVGFFEGVQRMAKSVPQLTLHTQLGYDQYVRQLVTSDLVVVPSRDDTLPLVSLHAMGASKPLMCTLSTGTSEYLENEVSGFVISSNHPPAITQALMDAIGNAGKWHEIGRAGKVLFDQHFSRDRFSNLLLEEIGTARELASAA